MDPTGIEPASGVPETMYSSAAFAVDLENGRGDKKCLRRRPLSYFHMRDLNPISPDRLRKRHRSAFPNGACFVVDVVPDCIRRGRFPNQIHFNQRSRRPVLNKTSQKGLCSTRLSYHRFPDERDSNPRPQH